MLICAAPASAASIAELRFDDAVQLADTALVLNGLGLRSAAWLKGYAAGLYLPSKATLAAQVLAQPGPKRLQLRMLIDVPAREFSKAFAVGMRRNVGEAERAAMGERMAQFDRTVAQLGTVRKGDVVNLDFLPGRGLLMSLNGAPRGTPIAGDDLYAGLLKIFIGERPVDAQLKLGLLGG